MMTALKPRTTSLCCLFSPLRSTHIQVNITTHHATPLGDEVGNSSPCLDANTPTLADRQPRDVSWSAFPAEFRLMIFRYLASDKCRPYKSSQSRQHERARWNSSSVRGEQSRFVAVSHEWQDFFESHNFAKLILGHRDMENFNSIVCHSRRGVFVRRIWLRIELPTYGCDKCYTEESPDEHKAHEVKFTVALSSLLGYLSSLRNDHPGIILELSAHSPSDSEHVCKVMRDTMRDTLWYASGVRRSTAQLYEQRHLWIAGSRKPLLPVQAHRLHGKAEGLGIDREVAGLMHIGPCELPLSCAVTELVIRLQFSRYFSVRRGLSTIIKSLPQLRSLRYECRSGWGHLVEPLYNRVYEIRKRDHIYLLTHVLPRCKTLSAVNFFEVTEQHYSSSPWWRVFDPSAGHALRDNTSHLESLNFENFVDAIDFLDGTLPERKLQSTSKRYEWPHLKRLRLTTNLIPTSSFRALLQSAALVAGRMPELRVMDFVGLGQNERFVYFVRDRQHVIVVPRGTAPRLNGATIRLWQDLSVIRGSPYDLKIQEIEEDGTIGGMPVDLQIGCSCTRTTEIQQGMSTEWKRW